MDGSIKALEWNRFLELAAEAALSEPGRARLLDLGDERHWARDLAHAQQLQHETQEVLALLDRDALWDPLQGLADPTKALEALERGSVLELSDFVLLRRWLYAIDSWVQTPRDEVRGERFKKALSALSDPFEPLRILDRILTPDGELSEKASPKLAAIYAEIRHLKKEIGATLDQVTKSLTQKGLLREGATDLRDGRYVIPVKASHQGDVAGNVYEASVSKQTVFIEPAEVAPMNNRLRQRQNDLVQEIYRILEETSAQMKPFGPEIGAAAQILSYWDAAHAKARTGRRYGGKPLEVTAERGFSLQQTAHPLLWWSLPPEKIVRNDIEAGEPAQMLLLTGPNTGGKTVILKTLGMAGICARTGFPFPAVERPTVPFFDSFFADLGDPQSIEQHLSSFSGHVLRFREVLARVTSQSLVLLDELNAATDPQEGAALSRAFVETIMARGAMIVTTTHDPNLKILAFSDPRILNASMVFDEESREPTYQLIFGVPGRSHALETAERLGLPGDVLALARQYLTREHTEFEGLLAKLESQSQEAVRARKEAYALREEAEKLKKEWTERTESSVGEMLDRTRQKLRRILEQAQDEVRANVRKLDEMRSRREIDQTRANLNQTFAVSASRLESALAEEAPDVAEVLAKKEAEAPKPELPPLKEGTVVRIPKWKSTGTVLELKGEKAKVAMGNIQMVLSVHDIEPLPTNEVAAAVAAHKPVAKPQKKFVDLDAPPAPPSQLDLRGVRFDDAMSELERYLDQAFRSGSLAEVTIVHGLGSGALREGTRKVLKSLPYVKEFRDGGAGRGGSGATVVEFDRD